MGLSLRKSRDIRSKESNSASLSMVKKRQASSGDSTFGKMIGIGFLCSRVAIVYLTRLLATNLESHTQATNYTAEASNSSLGASSSSDTTTMVVVPLATSSKSTGMVKSEWVSFIFVKMTIKIAMKVTSCAKGAPSTRLTAPTKSLATD